jgi:hypothetical protein
LLRVKIKALQTNTYSISRFLLLTIVNKLADIDGIEEEVIACIYRQR